MGSESGAWFSHRCRRLHHHIIAVIALNNFSKGFVTGLQAMFLKFPVIKSWVFQLFASGCWQMSTRYVCGSYSLGRHSC